MSTKKLFKDSLEIPEKVQVELDVHTLKVKGEKGELQRKVMLPNINVKLEDKNIIFTSKYTTKNEKRIVNTYKAHINNMFNGVTEGYKYTLKICSGHFPMTVEVQNKELIIKNFFGEKVARKAKILDNVEVKVSGDEILVEGIDKEAAGQTAANMERATKIKNRDKRIFQDGLWIMEKAGRPIR